jgi:hypothetical protein
MSFDDLGKPLFMEPNRLVGKTTFIPMNYWKLARSACVSDEKQCYSGGIDVGYHVAVLLH